MTRAFYRLLLRLYPEEFRERFGDEMVELAHEQRYRPWLLVRDVATSLVSAHRAARRARKTRYRKAPMRGVGKDLAVALRGIRNAPGFAAIAIVTIALGIGATTAIFSVVHAVALRPLPYQQPDRLVTLWSVYTSSGRRGRMSLPDVDDVRTSVRTLESVASYSSDGLTLIGLGEPRVVPGAHVGGGLLEVFGVTPLLGRDLRREENVPNGPRVAVIGHRFWQDELGGDSDVLGTTITISGERYEIVGVAPPGFDFPDRSELWVPAYQNVESCGRGCHNVHVIGRLAPGAAIESVQAELATLAARLADVYQDTNRGKVFDVISLRDTVVGEDVRSALFILLAAVAVVLSIASANVAQLLLARASARTGEMAVRSALGASRARLVWQLFVEALVLAVLGGLSGVLLARWAVAGLVVLAPDNLPRIHEVAIDGTVLGFACVAVFGSCFLFGLAPALSISRNARRTSHRLDTDGPGHSRLRSLLLTVQVALSLVLLFGAGLLLRSLSELRDQTIGYDPDDAVAFTLVLPDADYPEPRDAVRFFETLEERLVALPGVEAAGSAFGSPMSSTRVQGDITFFDRPAPPPGEEEGSAIRAVTPGYANALRVPILRGRFIEPRDRHGAAPVAVVNRSFAEHFYPGRDPLGQQIRLHASFGYHESEPRTIVGIVGDLRLRRVAEPAAPEVWAPQAQMGSTYLSVVVRGAGSDGLGAIAAEVHRIDPNLPLQDVETLATAVERSFGATRFYSLLLALFAALAVALASVGVYGVVSYVVSRRTQEIGLRMALGADAHDVIRLILSEGLRPAVIGVAVGVGGAVACGRLLESMLYNVQPVDVSTLALATLALLVAAVPALVLPARRASLVSPLSSLRID